MGAVQQHGDDHLLRQVAEVTSQETRDIGRDPDARAIPCRAAVATIEDEALDGDRAHETGRETARRRDAIEGTRVGVLRHGGSRVWIVVKKKARPLRSRAHLPRAAKRTGESTAATTACGARGRALVGLLGLIPLVVGVGLVAQLVVEVLLGVVELLDGRGCRLFHDRHRFLSLLR